MRSASGHAKGDRSAPLPPFSLGGRYGSFRSLLASEGAERGAAAGSLAEQPRGAGVAFPKAF